MQGASSWDPARYLQYGDERLRPALDLLARIPAEKPGHVVDLGCGAGNVTRILHERWPGADMLGIDGSAAMLDRARQNAPHIRFEQDDVASWTPDRTPDVIYSNAALHWLGHHASLFPRLVSELPHGGILAVQIPNMHAEPLRRLQYEVAAHGPWAETLRGVGSAPDILTPGEYWDILRPLVSELDLWETVYLHALAGENAVVQWALGSSLRPFMDRLPGQHHDAFLAAYGEALAPHYPPRADGTTLLPFRRLFLVARR
jgi:trans-aconitate 2-methyltransferase